MSPMNANAEGAGQPEGGASRRFRFLANPSSGGGRAHEALVPVASLLRAAGCRVEVTWSPSVESVADLAAQAVEAGEIVVAVGGDGMVASLAGPMSDLAASGGVLGLVPAGRGNDFARMLGVGGSAAEIAERLVHGVPRLVDVIDCDGSVVAGSVYAGIDSDAALMVSRMRRTPKVLQYPVAGVRALLRHAPRPHRVVVDGHLHEIDAAMVVVANSQFYGKGMKVAPDAVVDDGQLDVIVVDGVGRWRLLVKMASIYRGTHVNDPAVHTFRGREVLLSVAGVPAMPLGGDGEDLGVVAGFEATPTRIRVRERALCVL